MTTLRITVGGNFDGSFSTQFFTNAGDDANVVYVGDYQNAGVSAQNPPDNDAVVYYNITAQVLTGFYFGGNPATPVRTSSGGFSFDLGTHTGTVTLRGGSFGDLLRSGAGIDTLRGNGGDDTLEGGGAADALFGDAGSDTVSYAHASSFVAVSLETPANNQALSPGSDSAGDTYDSIENILGSAFGDQLEGNGAGNVITGGGGNDTIRGLGGNDIVVFSGARVDYEVHFDGGLGAYIVTDLRGGTPDGVDTVYSTEFFQFSDRQLSAAQVENEAPVLTGDLAFTVAEGGDYILTTADVNFTDLDDVAAGVTFSTSNLVNGVIRVNGSVANSFTGAQLSAGQVVFRHDGTNTLTASFSVSVDDGNEDATTPVAQTVNVTVTPVNDAPTFSATALNPTFMENGAAVDLFSGVTLSPEDPGQGIVGIGLRISGVQDGATEFLIIDGTQVALVPGTLGTTAGSGLNYTVNISGGVIQVAFGQVPAPGVATATMQAIIDGLAYLNTSDDPGSAARVVSIDYVSDGEGGAEAITPNIASTVTMTPVNDPPVFAATALDPAFTENGAAVDLFSGVSVSAVESGQGIVGVVTRVSGVQDGATEFLVIDGTQIALAAGTAGSTAGSGLTYVVTANGGAIDVGLYKLSVPAVPAATMQAIIDGMAYLNTSDDPGATSRTVSIEFVSDGAGTANGGAESVVPGIASTVTVTPVNDPVVLANALANQTGTEDTAVSFTLPANAFSDADSGALTYTATLANGTPLPGWLVFDAAARSFSGTPPLNFNGTVSVAVTASDASTSASDIFDLVIGAVNDAPVSAADTAAVATGAAATGSVLANDTDVDGPPLAVAQAAAGGGALQILPAGGVTLAGTRGTLTLQRDGSYSYAANAGGLLVGETATDTFSYVASDGSLAAGVATLTVTVMGSSQGSAGADTLRAFPGGATINGNGGNDLLVGDAGSDTLNGGDDNDTLDGGAGSDVLDGGAGVDTASFVYAPQGVLANLTSRIALGGGATDTLTGIENIAGSSFDDVLIGDAGPNTLVGSGGNDVLDGGFGNDTLLGGDGFDTVSYASSLAGVIVSLALQNAGQDTGGAGIDFLSGFEALAGSQFADVLSGDAAANVIAGGGGADTIRGGGGADVLVGGEGPDFFQLLSLADSTLAAPDIIADFQAGIDKIDFRFLRTGAADSVSIASAGGYTMVTFDAGGNGTPDARVLLVGAPAITLADILLVNPTASALAGGDDGYLLA